MVNQTATRAYSPSRFGQPRSSRYKPCYRDKCSSSTRGRTVTRHDAPAPRRSARSRRGAFTRRTRRHLIYPRRRGRRGTASSASILTDNWPPGKNAQSTSHSRDTVGQWDGDTLVLDAIAFSDQTRIGRGGFFHSDKMRVVEKFTRQGDALLYDGTIEEPEVLAQPWVFPTRTVRRNANPDAGLIRERGSCEVFETEAVATQIRH